MHEFTLSKRVAETIWVREAHGHGSLERTGPYISRLRTEVKAFLLGRGVQQRRLVELSRFRQNSVLA